ncbi:MAG: hypothetical protein MI757_17470 [Pirellulales bacterium]|nr:hypothetical protein [Pirellulales bacterium]
MWIRKFVAMVAFGLTLVMASSALAADSKKESSKTAKSTKKAKDPKQPRGRLPAYFRQVVDDKQRNQIYALQTKYRADRDEIGEEIKRITADLRKKLAELKQAHDKEVEAVLSAEQLAKVQKLRDEAAAKRKAKSSASSKTTAKKS